MAVEFFYEFVPLADGSPNINGIVKTYAAGTTTPKVTYPTYADAVAQTNPNATTFTLAADGVVTFWLNGPTKIDVQTSAGVSIAGWPKDNINAATTEATSVQTGYRNKIINGDFSRWTRATSQAIAGYGSADRYAIQLTGSTQVLSRQTFTPGSSNSRYYAQCVVTSVPNANNFVFLTQRIEDVTMLQGQTVTVSFVAWSNAARNIAIELTQDFGLGGAPSAAVGSIGSQLVAIATTPARYSVTINIPSITGKTMGTTANTSYTALNFWMDAGATFNARAASLGQQSGTFNFSDVQLEYGALATAFERTPAPDTELRCQRYYEIAGVALGGHCASTSIGRAGLTYKVTKRITPTVALDLGVAAVNSLAGNLVIASIVTNNNSPYGCYIDFNVAAVMTAGQGCTMTFGQTPGVDALKIESEL